jgi:arginyl-tRNA--protein-N-Asp/Glu arginylyltransferase
VANTAVSSENFAVADSFEVGKSAVYSRYNNGPRTLSFGTLALNETVQVTSKLYLVAVQV